jgi:hypothetical protein
MFEVVLEDTLFPGPNSASTSDAPRLAASNNAMVEDRRIVAGTIADRTSGSRRTPRKSVIVILPDNHVVSPDAVADSLPHTEDHELVDVIIACAGQPANLPAMARFGRDIQMLFAPAGTSGEDLRELAMRQAPGDIVTLIGGAAVPSGTREFEMTGTA